MNDVDVRPTPPAGTLTGPKKMALLAAAGGALGFALGWAAGLFIPDASLLGLGALGMCVGAGAGAVLARLMDGNLK
jgi:hypothetical protein